MKSIYENSTAAFATKHNKVQLVADDFALICGIEVKEAPVDTDQLGTFSGEIERILPHKDNAILKAKMGAQLLGLEIGIASEGSIGPDPATPLISSDVETMVFIDLKRDLKIIENYRSFDIVAINTTAKIDSDLTSFLKRADFPNHKLIVRAQNYATPIKGISSLPELESAIKLVAKNSEKEEVVIESDLRAFCSPSRQRNIKMVSERLIKRIASNCPKCNTPGWGEITYERGLSCLMCGREKEGAVRQEILNCISCTYSERGKVVAENLDPRFCNYCNP